MIERIISIIFQLKEEEKFIFRAKLLYNINDENESNGMMKEVKKHIVILTPGFAENAEDTSSVTYLLNYILQFRKENPSYVFTIIALSYPFKEGQYLWNGCQVYAFGLYKKSKIRKLNSWVRIYRLLTKLHLQKPIDAIHSMWLKEGALLGQILSRRLKCKFIVTAMGMELCTPNAYLKFMNFKKMRLVCVSQRQLDTSKTKFKGHNITIIPWGINKLDFKEGSGNRPIDLLFVGYLNPNKNLNLAIEIIASLSKKFKNLKAEIIGDYFNLQEWKNEINLRNLSPFIHFNGKLSNKETLEKMSISKILLHTSSFESFGYVFLEALASGMYVVTKPVGIAKASTNVKIAYNQTEYEELLFGLLNDFKAPTPEYPYLLGDTIEMYKGLYEN